MDQETDKAFKVFQRESRARDDGEDDDLKAASQNIKLYILDVVCFGLDINKHSVLAGKCLKLLIRCLFCVFLTNEGGEG